MSQSLYKYWGHILNMQECPELEKISYGFENKGIKVYSNIPESLARDWTANLSRVNKETHFLDSEKTLVLVDLNKNYLDYLVRQAFGDVIQGTSGRHQTRRFKHHRSDNFIDSYAGREGTKVVEVLGRLKGTDSLAEKLARINFSEESMACAADYSPNHISVRDAYGFKVITNEGDTEAAEAIRQKVRNHPQIEMVCERDHETSQYKSRHDFLRWKGNTIPPGMIFEAHYETRDEYEDNTNGTNGARSHDKYGENKLEKDHVQGNNQIVLLLKDNVDRERIELEQVSNGFVEYTLVHY